MSENKETGCCGTEAKSTSSCCHDCTEGCKTTIVVINCSEAAQGKNRCGDNKSCCDDKDEGSCC